MKRRIGILTGGGDVPGLNPVIKSVVYRSTELGYEVLGIRRGWEGLTHMRPGPEPDPEYIWPLDRQNTRAIDRTGGTILHTSRTNPQKLNEARLPTHLDAAERARYAVGDGVYDLTPVKALPDGLHLHWYVTKDGKLRRMVQSADDVIDQASGKRGPASLTTDVDSYEVLANTPAHQELLR